MFAIVESGGKQYRVEEGTVLRVEKLAAAEGDQVILDHVLLIGDNGKIATGTPYLDGASVVTKVQAQGKGKKIIVFKYKAKKNYRRKAGHRQLFTELKVEKINPSAVQATVAE